MVAENMFGYYVYRFSCCRFCINDVVITRACFVIHIAIVT